MKNKSYFLAILFCALFFAPDVKAQFGVADSSDENLRYYKEKYEATYEYDFVELKNIVIASIKESFAGIIPGGQCEMAQVTERQDDAGLFRGKVESEYCVFVNGDETFSTLKLYSKRIPVIRGGVWHNGRVQYKFLLKEGDNGTVSFTLKCEISGLEDNVTHEIHFWESNGFFEKWVLEAIEKKVKG